MQIELHRNNVYQEVELLLLVPMLSLLAIPKCLLIFKENVYYTSCIRNTVCVYVELSWQFPCFDYTVYPLIFVRTRY